MKVSGKKPRGYSVPAWLGKLINQDMVLQFMWNNDPGWKIDLDDVRKLLSGVTSFGQFLRKHRVSHL